MLEDTTRMEEIEKEDFKLTEQKDYSYIADTSITQSKSDMGFLTLVDAFNRRLYVIPKYQRKYIWTKEQVENLAISLIRGLPIPPIYVYRNGKGQLEILDGQQRMLSLFLYYKGKYFKNSTNTSIELQELMIDNRLNNEEVSFGKLLQEKYPLKDVKYELKYIENDKEKQEKIVDITYDQLPRNIKNRLDFTPISVIQINVDSEKEKHRMLYKVFENLNSGGTELKNQELRNGVYQSGFYDMLHEINNKNKKWRDLYGPKHTHSRDVELLLRFTAIQYYFTVEAEQVILNNYHDSYPKLLNDFSNEALKFDKKRNDLYRTNLIEFIKKLELEGRIPNLLLESLYFASQHIDGEYKIDSSLCRDILDDERYKENIKKSSSSKLKTKARLQFIYEKLSEYVNR